MKAIDLYNIKEESKTKDISMLKGFYYNHIPEIIDDFYIENNDKIEIKIIKEHNFDYRRYWRLATVWFENKPIMIIRNAGREGDDHRSRFVTDKENYIKMIEYIKSLINTEYSIEDLIDANDDIDKLDYFYGYSLSSF